MSFLPAPAQAARAHFGDDEKLHVIAPTPLVNDGKPISLCYKTSTYFFVAGVYTTDEYVLCEGGTSKTYWPMPAGERLAELQRQGMLPSPLPAYKRDAIDYVVGYSLWLVMAFVVLGYFLTRSRSKIEGEKNLDLLKSSVRRVMARTMANANAGPYSGAAAAGQIYRSLFNEPLQDADFSAAMKWVREEPAAYDGFIGAIGRKFNNETKGLLLRVAVGIAQADGNVDAGELEAIRHLAERLGMKPAEVDKFLTMLLQQPGLQEGRMDRVSV